MKEFKRALVALDLSAMDDHVLRYFSFISGVLETQKVYFVHIIPNFKMPKHVDVEFHKLFAPEYPIDEKVRDKLALDIEEYFGDREELDLNIEVIEGQPYNKLLHWTEVKEIDLLVVGHKLHSEGSGITTRRIARQSDSHILFIPEKTSAGIRKILVPIDFSANSRNALNTAISISRNLKDVAVVPLYIVEMPAGEYYARSFKNTGYRSVLMDSAKITYQKFLEESGLSSSPLVPVFIENDYQNTARHIVDYADDESFDLIIMGAQGHTAFQNFLFGSVTERLVERCKSKPILVVR